jgi:DNA-binding winged helix-turn-helix (wHTH) protein
VGYRFAGGCEFDEKSGEVRRNGTTARLEPQPAALLSLLAQRAGDLVTHAEIRRAIWGDDTHVNFQDGVHYCIRQIRAALGDRAQDPRLIITVPRRGYRIGADAILAPGSGPAESSLPVSRSEASIPVPRHPPGRRRRLTLAWVAVAVIASIALVERQPNDHHQIAVTVLTTLHDLMF